MVSFPVLYLNENINPKIVNLLAGFGINAIHTLSAGNQGVSDEFQINFAAKNGYILVTHNRKDFKKIHKIWLENGKFHPGIIIIRPSEPKRIAKRLRMFLEDVFPNISAPFCKSPPNIPQVEL